MNKHNLSHNAVIVATVVAAFTAERVIMGSPFDWKTILPYLVGGLASALVVSLWSYFKNTKK